MNRRLIMAVVGAAILSTCGCGVLRGVFPDPAEKLPPERLDAPREWSPDLESVALVFSESGKNYMVAEHEGSIRVELEDAFRRKNYKVATLEEENIETIRDVFRDPDFDPGKMPDMGEKVPPDLLALVSVTELFHDSAHSFVPRINAYETPRGSTRIDLIHLIPLLPRPHIFAALSLRLVSVSKGTVNHTIVKTGFTEGESSSLYGALLARMAEDAGNSDAIPLRGTELGRPVVATSKAIP